MRVLVVDDDATSRRVLHGSLVGRGYDVVVASGGAEAWRVFQSENVPQLAIIDWMMPDINGTEVCALVRGFHPDHKNGTVPILNHPPMGLSCSRAKGRTTPQLVWLSAQTTIWRSRIGSRNCFYVCRSVSRRSSLNRV